MKRIILSVFLICLMALGVSALTQYTGQPQLPYIIYGHVNWNNQMLSGTRLEITNQNTGNVETVVTNGDGYWQTEAGNWLTTDAGRPPIMYGDVIKVRATDGCGTGDVCEKTFSAFTTGYKDYAVIDLVLTGTLSCPAVSCPSCSCSGGGGGGSGGGCIYSETLCRQKFPCEGSSCEPLSCPICPSCQETECTERLCPSCPNGESCEICQDQSDSIWSLLLAIITFVVGGGAAYVTFGRANKVKVVKKDGKDVLQHQHPTISGYHSPDTIHKLNAHKKGELLPKYEKNAEGKWIYKE